MTANCNPDCNPDHRATNVAQENYQARTGGVPGARTQNPRIKRRPLHRPDRTARTDFPRICPESTGCTGGSMALVPRVVPRHPGTGHRVPSPNVAEQRRGCPAARSRPHRLGCKPGAGNDEGAREFRAVSLTWLPAVAEHSGNGTISGTSI